MKNLKIAVSLICAVLTVLLFVANALPVSAMETSELTETDLGVAHVINSNGWSSNWAGVSSVSQFSDNHGNLCFAVGDWITTGTVTVYRIRNQKTERLFSVPGDGMSLGAAICDGNGYFYLVRGRYNETDNTETATIFVSKYTEKGVLLKTVSGNGGESLSAYFGQEFRTKNPFHAGNCDVAINGKLLMVNYAREMYNEHQSNALFTVNLDTMTVVDSFKLYDSHSFDQRVTAYSKTGGFLVASHGDCFERCFNVSVTDTEKTVGKKFQCFDFWVEEGAYDRFDMGQINRTYARLGNVLETGSGVALVGSSARSLSSSARSEKRDVFIQIFDPNGDSSKASTYVTTGTRSGVAGRNGTTKTTNYGVKWLTSLEGTPYSVDVVQAITTDDDRIVVLYELSQNMVFQSTQYLILNAKGEVLKSATSLGGVRLNRDEDPVYLDGAVQWISNPKNSDRLVCYSLDVDISNTVRIRKQPTSYEGPIGDMASFRVTARGTGLTYRWQYSMDGGVSWRNCTDDGAKTEELSPIITEKNRNYLYRCVVRGTDGKRVITESVGYTVTKELKLTACPTDFTTSVGRTVNLQAAAIGNGVTYQWQYSTDGGTGWANCTEESARSSTLSFEAAEEHQSTLFRCVVSGKDGQRKITPAVICTLVEGVRVTSQPKDYTGSVNDTATFSVKATGKGLTYQWQYARGKDKIWRDCTFVGADTPTVSYKMDSRRLSYMFRCIVTDAYGNQVTTEAVGFVLRDGMRFRYQIYNYQAKLGEMSVLYVEVYGVEPSYQWQYSEDDGETWTDCAESSSTTCAYTLEATSACLGRKYRCVVTDRTGTVLISDTATLLIRDDNP